MNNNQQNKPTQTSQQSKSSFIKAIVIIAAVVIASTILFPGFSSSQALSISYSDFLKLVEADMVAQVALGDQTMSITLKNTADTQAVAAILFPEGTAGVNASALSNIKCVTGLMNDPDLVRRLGEHNVDFYQAIAQSPSLLMTILGWIMPLAILLLFYLFVFRYLSKRMGAGSGESGGLGGMMNGMMGGVGKSKAKVYNVEERTGVTFRDVAGQNEAKESLTEMVDYLHHPEKYSKIGAKQPRGALLVGPPGTGKTLLAKAVAGEANVPFFHLTGSEFVEMFVGVGASRVRDLFATAKKNAPCIIFIDEIDAIGKRRDNQLGNNDEREQTLNQLLSEMDGFDTSSGIVVLAATNRPEILDKALLRPGRFDRRVIVDKPDLIGRRSILEVHAANVNMEPDVALHNIALATSGATGADLANIVNEAALRAVKMGRESVLQEDLLEAVEVIIAGKEKKDRILSVEERRIVAYHEVGHAVVSAIQKKGQPVQKITIVPRTMGSLGYTMNVPEEERFLMTRKEMLAEITALLGGRAAEIVEFSDTSTGAANDIERATKLARSMVTQYGMSDVFGSMGLESSEAQYLDGRNVATCSEQTLASADQEVRKIIESCQQKAIDLLIEKQAAMGRIAEYLLVRENITGEEFMQLFGGEMVVA